MNLYSPRTEQILISVGVAFSSFLHFGENSEQKPSETRPKILVYQTPIFKNNFNIQFIFDRSKYLKLFKKYCF